MADLQQELNGIRANAEMVIQEFTALSGEPFGYDAESVLWTDGFIERQRNGSRLTPATANQLTSVLGSYLGECVIRHYGGNWAKHEGQWAIDFDGQHRAYPFNKVAKRFANGEDDSLYSFLTTLPLVLQRQLLPDAPKRGVPTPAPASQPAVTTSPAGQTRDLLSSLKRWFPGG